MNVTGCNDRFPEVFAQFNNSFIEIDNIVNGLDGIISHHKHIITQWLYFKIIVK